MAPALDPLTLPLHGTRMIEASAGTGKTYTIAALYLRLILAHGAHNGFARALTPPEILVVTFTNAATQELRERIRLRLAEAAACFQGRVPGDDFLQALRSETPADQWPGRALILEQAAQWMDEAAIYTIHGWSQRMLRRHAFDSGGLFEQQLEPDEGDMLENAVCDYWRCHFYPQPRPVLEALIDLLGCATPQDLLLRVRPLLNQPPDAAEDPFARLEQRRLAIEEARRAWVADFENAVERLRRAQADKTLKGGMYRAESLEAWLAQLTGWVHGAGPLPDPKARLKLSSSGLRAGLAKNRTLPEHPAYDAFDRLEAQLADGDLRAALYGHAAAQIARRFQKEKQRRGLMDFDDLLQQFRQALHGPGGERLAQAVRTQFPAALVDEFQDTDPAQYAALARIYANRPQCALLMIGDPKQAIYAFRGADIHTYLQARRSVAADARHTLLTNYRSTDGLVRAVNQLFKTAAGDPRGAFLFGDQIPFEAAGARGRAEQLQIDGRPAQSLFLWYHPQAEGMTKTGPGGYLAIMANAFAAQIARLLNLAQEQPPLAGFAVQGRMAQALRPADIAVLVRDGSEAEAMRRALAAHSLRSVYLSDKESVFDSPEARDVCDLLRACAEPERDRLLRTALAVPVLALPLDRLDRLNRDETAWESEVERFKHFQQIWRARGVLPMLRALLRAYDVPARLLCADGGERVLTNLLHLCELLQTEARNLEGEQALLRWFAQQLCGRPATGTGEGEERIVRLESDADLIRVVTIHKAKGLEYPLVFVPFVCCYREVNRRNASIVRYHDASGRLIHERSPGDEHYAAADRERLAEDLRLFYVAVTRARHACWLGLASLRTSPLHRSAPGFLMGADETTDPAALHALLHQWQGGCADIAVEPLPAGTVVYRPRTQAPRLGPALTFSGKIPRNWWIASYSAILTDTGPSPWSLPSSQADASVPDAPHSAVEDQLHENERDIAAQPRGEAAAPRGMHAFPAGPGPGTFLHGLLEWAAREGFGGLAADRRRIEEKMDEICAPLGWQAWAEVLTGWLWDLLGMPIPLPGQKEPLVLARLDDSRYQPEMEFLFAAHGVAVAGLDRLLTRHVLAGQARPPLPPGLVDGMLKGYVDLVFRHGGRYYVMDYKSNHLGPDEQAYSPAAMCAAMLAHRYDLQSVLYILALHRLLKARLRGYDYDRDVGGAVYLFLRGATSGGSGIHADKPPRGLIETLDQTFAGKENARAN